jgi:hypothetical protein
MTAAEHLHISPILSHLPQALQLKFIEHWSGSLPTSYTTFGSYLRLLLLSIDEYDSSPQAQDNIPDCQQLPYPPRLRYVHEKELIDEHKQFKGDGNKSAGVNTLSPLGDGCSADLSSTFNEAQPVSNSDESESPQNCSKKQMSMFTIPCPEKGCSRYFNRKSSATRHYNDTHRPKELY